MSKPGDTPFFQFDIDPDFLAMATANKQMYDALVDVGFTREEAMAYVIGIGQSQLQTNMIINSEKDSDGTD